MPLPLPCDWIAPDDATFLQITTRPNKIPKSNDPKALEIEQNQGDSGGDMTLRTKERHHAVEIFKGIFGLMASGNLPLGLPGVRRA